VTSADFEPTKRTRLHRLAARGRYDRDTVHAILDEGLVCHLGFVQDGQPFVIPTAYGRADDLVYVHGSSASRALRVAASGVPVCVTVTHLDGIVLARSIFNHSMNYRSVVILGVAVPLLDENEKLRALQILTERLVPGRWEDARRPNSKEIRATTILRIPLDEASAKVRSGPPSDDEDDMALPVWAGTLPLAHEFMAPRSDPRLAPGIEAPPYVSGYRRPR
jgi:nitroimidazol reductase NimA-like FMN-containing flavoprotein (pyridoxamine 5'-phosphate oxidase superfamily)